MWVGVVLALVGAVLAAVTHVTRTRSQAREHDRARADVALWRTAYADLARSPR
jgi:hypothetical protein